VESLLIRDPDELEELASTWNAAPPSRGPQADPYDSQAWIAAWAAADPQGAEGFVCPAIVEDGRLLAALPMTARGTAWRPAGTGWRPRFRVICHGQAPHPEAADRLVETAFEAGARRLELAAMPVRDPATGRLRDALVRGGCTVDERPGSAECLGIVREGWDEHRRRFRKYERTVKNFSNKAARLGHLELRERVGDAGGLPEEAWRAYADLHARGWKGRLREPMRVHRRELFRRLAELGWLRVFTLDVAGAPAAAIVWMRVGPVAVAYSTVYDVRLAALSAGTILMWRAHEALVAERPVELFDYLPGRGPQKDQLGPDRSPLVTLDVRRRALLGLSGMRAARRARGWAGALRRRLRAGDRQPATRTEGGAEAVCGRFDGIEAPLPGGCAELQPAAERDLYLAVAGGHSSPKSMKQGWHEGDRWWRVGDPVAAVVRVDPDAPGPAGAREVVVVASDVRPSDVLDQLASHLGRPVETRPGPSGTAPIPVHRAPLPWPASL
jgi:hypothetical protein